MKRLLEGVIDEVIIQPKTVNPMIVNFQNGELKDEATETMSCGLFYDKQKEKKLLALSNGQIVYKGYTPDNKQQFMQTMLVLHNKKTGKIRLVQAERWSFGSKKVKRKTEQFERMKINVNAVKDDLEKTVSNIEINKEDLETQIVDNDYVTNIHLPQCNRDATNIKDVYNINDIIPENKLETLNETAKETINRVPEGKSKFFTHALRFLKSDPDNIKKVALLLYIEAVAKWLNMPIKDAKKRGINICPYSEEVNSYIIETYSIQSYSGRLRPASMKDKAIIHCIILGLIISDFVIDLELLATMLHNRIGIRKLIDLAKIIAAVPNKNDKKTFTLRLPLPEQVAMVKKGKKKRS
ncbi:uncharacterized protein LOC122628737 isoform X3 [Vespula pensylvanica]|uniref:uncharacterized protein LOC122628737 isoform X3 n=1 Tax=Vespula pensylvanica TaxID=30213 RepID=UPI001CBA0CFF|nr:uncharacterized protein LOC122628737 isoform X3 [Vespula pensylvanica]